MTVDPRHDFEQWLEDDALSGPPNDPHTRLLAGRLAPFVHAGQMVIGNLVTTFLSNRMGLTHVASVHDSITERANGIPKDIVYQRPYRVAAEAYRRGVELGSAIDLGERRLTGLVGVDMQMAKVRQSQVSLKAGGRKTFHRVTTSANPCELCQLASEQTYYTDELMPIHDGCSCEIEPGDDDGDASTHAEISDDEDNTLAIREHGEVGPVLTYADQNFKGPQDLPDPSTQLAFDRDGNAIFEGRKEHAHRQLTVGEVDERNNSNREQYRSRMDDRHLERNQDMRYAKGVNKGSRWARDDEDDE